ncbi:hypothetical protein TNCV_1385001 [Trichonephila clavipes]|nr:hypothetical protein TNCV_1385001 [Trichonephila clavipes]
MRHLALCHHEFSGPRSGLCRPSGISNNNNKGIIFRRLGGLVALSLASQGCRFDLGLSRWTFMMQRIDSDNVV